MNTHADASHLLSLVRHRLAQFVEPMETLEPWWRYDATREAWESAPAGFHATTLPPLLVQVELAAFGSPNAATSTGSWESRVPLSVDAVDVWRDMAQESAWILDQLKAPRGNLAENLVELSRRASALTVEALEELERYVRYWWISAKIVAGFEEPPLRPHMRCPLCDCQDSIRVRLDVAANAGAARCTACHETWDETTINLLIETIEREAAPRPRPAAPPPAIEYVFLGREGAARQWARSAGISPHLVFAATRGVDGLTGVRRPPKLVEHRGPLTFTEARRIDEVRAYVTSISAAQRNDDGSVIRAR